MRTRAGDNGPSAACKANRGHPATNSRVRLTQAEASTVLAERRQQWRVASAYYHVAVELDRIPNIDFMRRSSSLYHRPESIACRTPETVGSSCTRVNHLPLTFEPPRLESKFKFR
jgi:hypothetical protein